MYIFILVLASPSMVVWLNWRWTLGMDKSLHPQQTMDVHADVIKWNTFLLLAHCEGNHQSPVDSPHEGQWRRALMLSLICARTNGWANNRDAVMNYNAPGIQNLITAACLSSQRITQTTLCGIHDAYVRLNKKYAQQHRDKYQVECVTPPLLRSYITLEYEKLVLKDFKPHNGRPWNRDLLYPSGLGW